MESELRKPRASEAKVSYHRKQLLKMFARANDAAFLQLIWAVDALQSGQEAAAKPFLSAYPSNAAADSSLDTPLGIHRWELETLIVQLFLAPKELPRDQGNLIVDCSKFEAMRQTINRLRALENVESARYLSGDFTIWGEMNRIGQRQFHWQLGYFNAPQLYRYAYLYAQGKCADYFRTTYGFEITDLIFTGFGLFTAYLTTPWVPRKTSVPEIGLTDEVVQRAFPMLSCSHEEAKAETATLVAQAQHEHGSQIPTALLPSTLRKTPLLYVDNFDQLISPIPQTILLRVTAGLYHDLIQGGQEIINDANSRFERYCADLIAAMMDRFAVNPSYRYGPKGGQYDSPDILIKHQDKLTIIAECKATKLTYLAQFAENPFDAAKKQYAQIAKGIFQLWRFFSHLRRGLASDDVADDCCAMVITLDTFMPIARDLNNKVLADANALADEDGGIAPEDRKHVVICPIRDLESILSRATESSLLASLKASGEEKYQDWMLYNVHRDTGAAKEFGKPKRFPFDLENVLPWWGRLNELKKREETA